MSGNPEYRYKEISTAKYKSKRMERAEIERLCAEYLSKGKSIRVVEPATKTIMKKARKLTCLF